MPAATRSGHTQRPAGHLRPQPRGPGRGPRRAANHLETRQPGDDALAAVAGHSLGEYTALVAAGALEAGAGARLVQARGEAMQAAAEAKPGTMAAVLGLDLAGVAEACEEARRGVGRQRQHPGPGRRGGDADRRRGGGPRRAPAGGQTGRLPAGRRRFPFAL